MDWNGMDGIVQQWMHQHSPFLKDCILNFIENLHKVARSLLDEADFLTAAQYFAKAIQLYNVLDRDGHLNVRQDRDNRNLTYYLHAKACIHYSDDIAPQGLPFLEISLHSLQRVSGDLIADKKILRLIANLKRELLVYINSGAVATIALDKIRKYNSELLTLDHDKMKFVMSFFGSGDPREFFKGLWSLLGPTDEGANAADQGHHRNHGVEMDWIPKEHQLMVQRQHLQKQHHGKKKKSRRDGKYRPSHASVAAPQLPSGGGGGNVTPQGQGSREHHPSSERFSGASSTGQLGSRVNDGAPRTGKKPQSGVTNRPAGSTHNLSTRDVVGKKDGLTAKVLSQETTSTTSNVTRPQRAGSVGQPVAGPGVLGTERGPISAEDWHGNYKFRLACRKCFTKEARKHGYDSYSLNMNPTHFPKCSRDYLLCQLARTPKNGHKVVYGLIRCRPANAKHSLCDDFQHGDQCKELSCCYCHSREEQDIWRAEKEGRFPRDDVIALLKAHGHLDHGKSKKRSNTPSRSRSESLVSQENDELKSWSINGARPRRESWVSLDNGDSNSRSSSSRSRSESLVDQSNGGTKRRNNSVTRSQSGSLQTSNLACSTLQHGDVSGSEASKEIYEATPHAVPVQNQFKVLQDDDENVSKTSGIKTCFHPPNPSSRGMRGSFLMSSGLPFHSSVWESPGSLTSQSNNSQKFQKIPGHSEGRSDKAVLDELKKIGGQFLLVCLECFEGRPVKISSPNPTKPNFCSYKNHSMSRMQNRCLVHRFGHGGFTKIRERPFRVMHKPQTICRYVDRLYGCERGDSCHFAHSEAEAKLWWLEARLGKERKEILQACIELNHPQADQHSLARSLQSNPEALINPHQGAWGIGSSNSSERGNNNNTLKQPPPTARAVAVESCRSKVPFGHLIKRACGRCLNMNPHRIQEQNCKRPSYCSGASPHSWGANILYVVHSSKDKQWVRVNSRHPRLWPNTKLRLCQNGKQCKQESVFRTACMHPHSLEELELWDYQKQHNLPKLKEVVHLQQQAQAASTALPKPEQLAAPQHTCSFCKFSCTSQTDFENHLLTTAHKAKIFSDSDRLWKERDPPNLVQDGIYKMCKENATKQCEHSGRSKDENECIYAHSMGELDEWKQRHQHRLMKLRKAREMKLYSWLDNLVDERTSAEEAEDVITEDIFGIEVECNRKVDVIQEIPTSETKSPIQNDVIQWHIVLHCGSEKKLKRVGLLFDEDRSHFHLSEPENEYRPQTCPGELLRHGSHYTISVNFIPSRSGLFKQWLVFDFRERPCLALKLSVTIGSKSEVKELEFKDQTVNTADLWNESNSKIIKCAQPDEWTQRLEEQYPTPGSDRGRALSGDVLGLDQHTYKEVMHQMLTDEERACMEIVAKYRTVTKMNVSDQVELEDSLLFAQRGELFGTIALDKPLHDDSEASRLVQEYVETILIKFHEQSDVVYEAMKVRSKKGAVVVSLGPACVKERRLKGGKNVSVTIQCCINRQRFLSMHHAVESLSCMDTVLPKGQQPNRFPEVADGECLEGLNSRQEQVVRLITSLGARGGEGTSYSGPTMILGPFGTGKTHTLAKAIQRTLTERKDAKFLICTHSNSAADLYIREYLHEFCEGRPDMWMVRVYATMRKLSTIRETVRKYMLINDAGPRLPTEDECKEWVSSKGPSIVVVTLSTAVHLTKTATLRGYFSHIVIDEAGQALETEAIIPLVLATEDTSVVLAGDPRQISPKVYSPRMLEAKFNMSLLQRLYKYDKQNDCHASCNLIINYRSCQPILDFLKVHYGTTFRSKSTSKEHPNLYPLNFVDVRGEDELVGTSYMNAEEAKMVADYVASLMQNWPEEEWDRPKQSEVVVLSPYRVQVELIRHEMRKRSLHAVTVETVQNVQGKQYRAVFLSTVRTRSSLNKIDITSLPQVGGRNVKKEYWYGFLSEKGLLNTAFTRAQSLITVMGDPVAICSAGECQKTWQRFIKTCEKNESIHSDQDLTMASIQNEIANAKRLLNPTAKVFVPRASTSSSASRGAPHTGSARPVVSRAIEVPSCSPRTKKEETSTREYSSSTKSRLPAPAFTAASAVDDDYDEDLLGDEWLRELKIQVDEDMAEEYRRLHPEMSAADQEEEAASGLESEGHDSAMEREENESAMLTREPEAYVRLQSSQREDATTVPNVAGRTEVQVLQNLRMVERDGRYALLQDDTYDSDDEDDVRIDTSGHSQESNVELLRKAVQKPDVYKICTFRQDFTGRTYAVPQDRQSGEEITITSMKRRGHALNSDKVLVEILENEEEQEVEEDDSERENEIYGRVEGIIEHNADLRLQKFVCYLDPQSDNVMVPIDRSSPKMLILGRKRRSATRNNAAVVTLYDITTRSAQLQNACSSRKEVEVKYSERSQKLFVVRYLEWPRKAPYPLGAAVEELEHGNTEQKGLNILRLVYGIKTQCKPAARQQMQQEFPEGWCLPDEAVQKREDLRMTRIVFTIDPPGSTDLDDAISCVSLPGQRYEVGVHIADVSYFIHQDSAMDKDAYKRGTTFYHPFQGDVYHMLPKDVISRLLSLLPGQDRLALSVIFIVDYEGQIVAEPEFVRSVIRSCQRLTYEEAENLIANSNNPSNEYMLVAEPIRHLYELSRHRRMQRLKDGWMVYNAYDDDGGALSHPHSHSLIEELMLMANKAVGEQVLDRFPDCTPLRRQLAPSQDQVETWKERHDKTARNSVRLPELVNRNQNGSQDQDESRFEGQDEDHVLVASEVWQMLRVYCESQDMSRSLMENMTNLILQDENHPQHAVALSDCYHIMESAEYIDSTSQTKPEKQEHYSLQMRAYTHFTSPIRRYIDLVVHRMLVACIENSQCPYTAGEMADITHHCNNQNAKSKRFEKATKELKLALKLKEAPLQATTFVEGISETSVKLLLPYRRYISSRQREIPYRFLKPSEKPNVGSTDVQLMWKCRMYDNSRKCQAESPASTRVTYPKQYFQIPEDKWQQILQSIKNMYVDGNLEGVENAIKSALIHGKGNGNPFSETARRGNQDGRPDRREMGVMSFQRSYQLGDPCRVQLHAQMVKGMLTPKVQLFNMTPRLDTCAEHRAQPIECFSSIATDIPGKEKNITEYKSKWLQILSMTSCYSAVSNDDTVIMQNVPIMWQRTSHEVTGHFQLDENFLEENHIPITLTREGVIRNNYDYLCIHLTNLDVESKPRLKIMEYDERGHRHYVGPFNASDWRKQTCVVHCRILKGQDSQDCHKCQILLHKDAGALPVHFVVHQQSVPLPQGLTDRHVASTVEFISKPEPNRREEAAVMAIDEAKMPVLVRDIALQRRNRPDWHSDQNLRILKREGEALTNLQVPESTLHPLNNSQQAAVKKALRGTFSIIQGPPGTGKTVTGAYLAYFFTRLNQQLTAGEKRPQVLYCGPSNKSVDVVAGYLKKFQNISIVRVYSEQIERKEYPIPGVPGLISKWSRKEASMPEEMADIALHRLIRKHGKPHAEEIAAYERRFRTSPNGIRPQDIKHYKSTVFEAMKLELNEHHIILCTCNAAGSPRIARSTRIIQVIVDEAGMCSEPETLIPLVSAKPNQVVLVGDHQQLRSIITEPNAKQLGMDISLLEKYKEKAEMLTIQYRMHVGICEFPSKAFYNDRLKTAESVTRRGPDPICRIWPNNGRTPRVFCHVNGREETLSVKSEEGNEMSKSNGAEIRHVIRIVREMINRAVSPEKIIILSQYRLQCTQIEERLRNDRNPLLQQIQVSTVVKSQGSEWDYVVFSTVRSKPRIEIEEKPSRGWQKKHLGFINDENQMNVALTRAKQGLIIVGNQYLLRCHQRWKEMLGMYEGTNCLVEAQNFLAHPR